MLKLICDECEEESEINSEIAMSREFRGFDFCSDKCFKAREDRTRKERCCKVGDGECTGDVSGCKCECGEEICEGHIHHKYDMCVKCGIGLAVKDIEKEEERLKGATKKTLALYSLYKESIEKLKEDEPELAEAITSGCPILDDEGDYWDFGDGSVQEDLIEYCADEEADREKGFIHWLYSGS